MSRDAREVVDEIDRLLAGDREVPLDLATELLCAMTAEDRARWLRVAVAHAWRPDEDGGWTRLPWPDDE